MSATPEEKQPWSWKRWVALLAPVFLAAAIPAGPQYLTWYKQLTYDVDADRVKDAQFMYELSMRNIDCIRRTTPLKVRMDDGRVMHVTACRSGDILRVFMGPAPASPRIDAWFGREERIDPMGPKNPRATDYRDLTFFTVPLAAASGQALYLVERICIQDYPHLGLLREVWKYSDGLCYRYDRYIHSNTAEPAEVCECSESACELQ